MRHWFNNYGFAFLVVGGGAAAAYLAITVTVPDPVPDFALQAREIYRLEIGMAFFVAFYLATMALVLALDGRGFAELGARGLKAGQVVDQAAGKHQRGFRHQVAINREHRKRLDEHEVRLETLEERSLS